MSIPGELLERTFWTLFAVETVAAAAMLVYVLGWGIRHAGPEGPVGAWLVFLPPLVLAGAWLVFIRAKSDNTKLAVVLFLALPLLQIAAGGAKSILGKVFAHRASQGDADFPRGPGRELAHAIAAQDPARVKTLLDAGALHKAATKPGGETFLRFAFVRAPQCAPEDPRSAAALEIVRLLLQAGANPNEPAFGSNWPLTLAIFRGADAVQIIVDGGADPNLLDGAGRPLWWDALGYRAEGLRTLEVLLNSGANLTFRSDSDGFGAAAWAVYRQDWKGALLLLDRGAPDCRADNVYGATVSDMIRGALQSSGDRPDPALVELARLYSVKD